MVIQNKRTRLLITGVVMLAAIMQIVDTTIVVVAQPHMEGSLGANPDQISWVLTSYLISSGIFMPLTGFLTDRLGQRFYLLLSITGFVIASMLCGMATSLDEIVLFRLIQGVAGAGLVPSAQSILVSIYPEEERGHAMAIFGVGAMVGPVLGPTLGGYLTQVFNWRWVFFVNLPVGVLAFMGAWMFVPETDRHERRTDWIGFAFLALAVSCMQFVLDRGQQDGWFNSHTIQVAAILSILGYVCLIIRNMEMGAGAIFRLSVFRDRNFASSCLLLAVFMFSMYGALDLQPIMLESLLNYPTLTAGLALAPRGIAAMISMFLAGRLITRVGVRPLVIFGLTCVFFGTFATTWYTPQIPLWWVIWPILVQGFGLGMVFVPIATAAFATLPPSQSAEAAGVRQLARTIGSSIGVAISSAIMTREGQEAWNQMGGHLTPFSPAVTHFFHHMPVQAGTPLAGALLAHILGPQTNWRGMLDAFYMMAMSTLLGFPLVFLLGKHVGKTPKGRVATE
ncbi:MAG TPA: DHA2 family efflux MFS transporter permease subunit [Gammaproteobacteria bacterium]|nr:DHA2 family efflux MFS transporter permease subunit [Gammaproteobacteria bacterium]